MYSYVEYLREDLTKISIFFVTFLQPLESKNVVAILFIN